MKLLLDTHVAIWTLSGDRRLREPERELLADAGNAIFVSAVSILEVAIKQAQRRGEALPFSAEQAIEGFRDMGFTMLNVTAAHAAAVESLPPLHGDPFDRLLVAQALTEPLRLVTHDKAVARYSDTVICFD